MGHILTKTQNVKLSSERSHSWTWTWREALNGLLLRQRVSFTLQLQRDTLPSPNAGFCTSDLLSFTYTTSLSVSVGFFVLRSEVMRKVLACQLESGTADGDAAHGTHEGPVIHRRDFRRVIRRSRLSVCARAFISHLHKQLSSVSQWSSAHRTTEL